MGRCGPRWADPSGRGLTPWRRGRRREGNRGVSPGRAKGVGKGGTCMGDGIVGRSGEIEGRRCHGPPGDLGKMRSLAAALAKSSLESRLPTSSCASSCPRDAPRPRQVLDGAPPTGVLLRLLMPKTAPQPRLAFADKKGQQGVEGGGGGMGSVVTEVSLGYFIFLSLIRTVSD
ncbi:hypothetical protein ZWY2020_038849 [Hordeum vulgare]|nr:hypothetical protein ZWY2020_038849 [Hordeum vulgare]